MNPTVGVQIDVKKALCNVKTNAIPTTIQIDGSENRLNLAWEPEKVFKFPMVWVNPVTGVRCFQILPDVVRKLYLKSGPDAEERVLEDDDVRVWLNKILDRICKPKYILIPEYEEGDVVMFNNWVRVSNFQNHVIRPVCVAADHHFCYREYCIAQSTTPPLTVYAQVSPKY